MVPQMLFTATEANGFDEGARLQNPNPPFKRGDLFEIILIQIKGGGARQPDKDEIKRLRDVAK